MGRKRTESGKDGEKKGKSREEGKSAVDGVVTMGPRMFLGLSVALEEFAAF